MKLKPLHSILIVTVLLACSAWASYSSYNHTRQDIVNDMNQALAQTLATKTEGWITPDTIHDYRSHLKLKALKECSFVYYAIDDNHKELSSRKMKWQKGNKPLEFQSYATCSAASIFSMSDQRTSGILSLLALLWSLYSIIYFKHHHKNIKKLGNLVLCETNQSFYDLHNQPVKLTPMQGQLMRMFFHADNHQLSKQKICNALWPKKPDASETLYTLIRRLKPIAEEKGNLEIISERGKDYQLRVRS